MITRLLFLLFSVILIATILWNGKALTNYAESLNLAADASAVLKDVPMTDSIVQVSKPTFMQVEKADQAELTSQVKIGYFLLRGF